MDPKMAPTNIRKSEEAPQGLQKCAQTLKGSTLESIWGHFGISLASVLKAFGAYLASFY